jgi:hypothetical protein
VDFLHHCDALAVSKEDRPCVFGLPNVVPVWTLLCLSWRIRRKSLSLMPHVRTLVRVSIPRAARLNKRPSAAQGWRWTQALFAVPKPLRDAIYSVVATNRYRIFGKYDACFVPDEGMRGRVIE